MDDLVLRCDANKCNIDLFVNRDNQSDKQFGVRLRPWSNSDRKGVMVLGAGATVAGALGVAVRKAALGDWERLDWAVRPWEVRRAASGWED